MYSTPSPINLNSLGPGCVQKIEVWIIETLGFTYVYMHYVCIYI